MVIFESGPLLWAFEWLLGVIRRACIGMAFELTTVFSKWDNCTFYDSVLP